MVLDIETIHMSSRAFLSLNQLLSLSTQRCPHALAKPHFQFSRYHTRQFVASFTRGDSRDTVRGRRPCTVKRRLLSSQSHESDARQNDQNENEDDASLTKDRISDVLDRLKHFAQPQVLQSNESSSPIFQEGDIAEMSSSPTHQEEGTTEEFVHDISEEDVAFLRVLLERAKGRGSNSKQSPLFLSGVHPSVPPKQIVDFFEGFGCTKARHGMSFPFPFFNRYLQIFNWY